MMRVSGRIGFAWVLLSTILLLSGCGPKSSGQSSAPVHIAAQLDWIPSAEYYGFFYARDKGYYSKNGLAVDFSYGTGAPQVAAQVAAGTVPIGTTTSDNIARQIARGSKIEAAAVLLGYNPNAIAFRPGLKVSTIASLRGKTIGVNEQSVAYQQFVHIATASGLGSDFTKYPIGYGGVDELLSGRVDGFLGYSTNQILLARQRNPAVGEMTFDQLGLHSYGLVLIAGDGIDKVPGGLDAYKRFLAATIKGYEEGGKDVDGAVAALRHAEPTLDAAQLRAAIVRVTNLRSAKSADVKSLDAWLANDGVSASAIQQMRMLLQDR